MSNLPTVSVVIPSYNEEKYIGKCLDSILAQDYPHHLMEVYVIDGGSTDATRAIVSGYIYREAAGRIKMLHNEEKIKSAGINKAIKGTLAEKIAICDAHSEYPPSYLGKIAQVGGENVGVDIDVRPANDSVQTKAFTHSRFKAFGIINNPKKNTAAAFNKGIKESHGDFVLLAGAHGTYSENYVRRSIDGASFGDNTGGTLETESKNPFFRRAKTDPTCASRFRRSNEKALAGYLEVSTVFGGCYKRDIFKRIGLFNENLIHTQDLEFNRRLKRAGGKILMATDIKATYYFPHATWRSFIKKCFMDGEWVVLPWLYAESPTSYRHWAPGFFVLGLPISLVPYIPLVLWRSFQIAREERDARFMIVMPLVFLAFHLSYGLGSIWAFLRNAKKFWRMAVGKRSISTIAAYS